MNVLPQRTRGLALVLVLWVLALLALVTAATHREQRTAVSLVLNAIELDRAGAAAEAGIRLMMTRLPPAAEPTPWPADGRLHPWHFAGFRLWVGAEPETARLDLNRAPESVLARLFEALGRKDDAVALARAVIDWRDRDGTPLTGGAEDPDYLADGRAIGARDGAFLSVQELGLVRGMTPALLERARPLLTVHGLHRMPDPGQAAGILRALQPAETAPREETGGPGRMPRRWRIHVVVEGADGLRLARTVVVDLQRPRAGGYTVLAVDTDPARLLPRVPEGGTGS